MIPVGVSITGAAHAPKLRPNIRPTRGLLITYAPPYALSAFTPDNGLATLAPVLQQNGHQVQILDYCTTETMRRLIPESASETLKDIWENIHAKLSIGQQPRFFDIARLLWLNHRLVGYEKAEASRVAAGLIDKIGKEDIDWIGFKLWNGSGYTIPVAIARAIKQARPDLTIFAGGSHVDYFGEAIYRTARAFDVLVFGDGEETLLRHVDRLGGSGEAAEAIPNSIFQIGSGFIRTKLQRVGNLDVQPFPLYDPQIYPAMSGLKLLMFIIEESRGCNNFCSFCGHSNKSGGRIVQRSARRVVDEMAHTQNVYGSGVFRFGGSSTPGTLMSEIAKEILQREEHFRYSAFARAKDVDPVDFTLWRASGHRGLFFGAESGSQALLDLMSKKVSVEQQLGAIKAAKAAGFFTVASFIFPSPGENLETERESLAFIRSANPDSVIVNPPIVIPGTPWQIDATDFGFELPDDYLSRALAFPIKHLLPPKLWPKAPWSLDGQSSRQLFARSGAFAKAVASMGIPTGISDDMALVAQVLNISPTELRDRVQRYFFTADIEALNALIGQFNSQVT
ncbi:hypothetical protein A2311_04825 [candidate division WOR-1 bacterium RIFOXYB2_FULL_48_7]|uniref:Uncharacterized protein n=1 Tax=candidate division WOR-1 bacterium RIFOXYB2_FULL_48_7 TaxID=1802583 RepID=A0A1F4TWB6_UNCSA|nr:MAG: hypothetical protein A2311_04825 [candidate division WOR-1 bacterium RIFOXYB2_FULL_48_7]